MESIGFKEWAMVCEALGRGEQSVILRKGGIAEGRDGFGFRSNEFFLVPTFFHEQAGKLRDSLTSLSAASENEIEIRFFAKLEFAALVTSWETVLALEPFHVWRREVVQERFEYDKTRGIHVAVVRIFRVESSWIIPNEARYGGCRSWVSLPELPNDKTVAPVLSDKAHAERSAKLKELLGGTR